MIDPKVKRELLAGVIVSVALAAGFWLTLSLSGCKKTSEQGVLTDQRSFTDPMTGCQYFEGSTGYGEVLTPRYDHDGRTVMGCH